jgi:hypothetical protein
VFEDHDQMRFAACAALGIAALSACTTPLPRKQIETQSIGTLKNVPMPIEDNTPGTTTSPNSGTANVAKEAACTMTDVENLEDALRSCDVPMPKQSDLPQLKEKLELKVTASTPTTTPGGRVDLVLTLRNKSDAPLALYFTGDPSPRFDVEAYDAKGRARVDLPAGKWPGYPKGFKPEARETKASRITLEKNGTARVKIAWDAVKLKWAPEKAKTWEGRGYPRTPAGPMPPGKYSLRAVVPLINEVDAPRVEIEVTK